MKLSEVYPHLMKIANENNLNINKLSDFKIARSILVNLYFSTC